MRHIIWRAGRPRPPGSRRRSPSPSMESRKICHIVSRQRRVCLRYDPSGSLNFIPEYCAIFAQYSLFANDGKALAKRRRVNRITQLGIRLTQVVSALSDQPMAETPCQSAFMLVDDGPKGENCTSSCNFQVTKYNYHCFISNAIHI